MVEWSEKDVYIGRGCTAKQLPASKRGNPGNIGVHGGRIHIVEKCWEHLLSNRQLLGELVELDGARLVCHCPPSEQCHADVLIDEFHKGARRREKMPPPTVPTDVESDMES